MKIKSIYIERDYFTFLIKDTLERMNNVIVVKDKNNELIKGISIPDPGIQHGLEHISFDKYDDKLVLSSRIYMIPSKTLDIKYFIFDNKKDIIGTIPPVDENTIKLFNSKMYDYYKKEYIHVITLTNWKIEFELDKTVNKVKVTLYDIHLNDMVDISIDSVKVFVHDSISKHFGI